MVRSRRWAVLLPVMLWLAPCIAAGQGGALARALTSESAGSCRQAFPLYRQAVGEGDIAAGLLGLERCAQQLDLSDTLLVVVDSVLARRPKDPVARTIQMRTLTGADRFEQAKVAFGQWAAASRGDAAPYREYARLLLQAGRPRTADTVLRAAATTLGSTRQIAAELAEMRASLGMWEASATSWREAMLLSPFLEQSAVYVLSQAPPASRDSVRAVLAAPPVTIHARRMLAALELRWRSATQAWQALSVLPPGDSAVTAWQEFAADAEQQGAWLAARDAYAAVLAHGGAPTLRLRAARAALQGGDAASALTLLQPMQASTEGTDVPATLALRIEALSEAGNPSAADSLLSSQGGVLDTASRDDAIRAVSWGWVRVGDLERAKASLQRVSAGMDGDRAAAWIALYEGDLKSARTGLRYLDEPSGDAVLAMSLLARTRADSSARAGEAFLALARRDTARAAALFEHAAADLADAAPLLLGTAARLYRETPDSARSLTIWQSLLADYAQSPEAAEGELEWARTLRRQGNKAAAIAHLEHLILTYPQSALVPQARRELELARGAVPPHT